MNKFVWITVLDKEKDEAQARLLHQAVQKFGLTPAGHFWRDDLFNMAWAAAREDLVRKETGLWLIVGSEAKLSEPDIRFGLSMLATGVQSQKGHGFPILIALTEGKLDPQTLPTPLKDAEVLEAKNPSLGVKITAKANMPVKKVALEYRLDTYGVQGIGQWFEVGPAAGHTWKGVMFGVDAGEINAHGVGEVQRLPEKSVVEYPMKGLKLNLGDKEFTAWAVQNEMTDKDSYYLRVKDYPGSILFGALTQDDEAEVFVVSMK